MSLINDALKKAQRQRTEGGTTPPLDPSSSPGATELHRVPRREKPAGFRSQLILVGGGAAAAVVVLAVGAIFFFRSNDRPAAPIPAPVATAPAPAVPATAPQAPPTAAPVAVTASVPTAAPASTSTPPPAQPVNIAAPTPATPAAPPAPAPSQFVPPPAPTPDTTAVATTSGNGPATAPGERPKASTRMIGVIEHLRVGGIRVSGTESKVLMNDRVYRLNDIVDHELGIKLTGIEAKALTFEDSRGAIHVRTF